MSAMPYDTGGGWDEDGYAVAPEPVSPAVAPGVSRPAAPPVAPVVAVVVSPDEDDAGEPGNDGPLRGVGRWTPAADDPPARPAGPGPGLRGLRAAVAGSELLGGGPGGLLAELADPHPETMRQHWAHVTGHPLRPEDRWGGAAFVAGHLAVTGPTKATGKTLVAIGTAFIFAGMRMDWAGDRFVRNVTPVIIAVTLILIVLVFA
jgi:hypothetical protein